MIDEQEVHLALRATLDTIAEIPSVLAWEQIDTTPTVAGDYIREEFIPGARQLTSAPADHADMTVNGLYVLTVYTATNQGDSGARAITAAILAAFAPMRAFGLPSSDKLYVNGNPAPWTGQNMPIGKGKSRCTVTIPWYVETLNAIPTF